MRSPWALPLAWLALVAWGQAAAMPTAETLVVSKIDEMPSTPIVLEESTTEEPAPPLKMLEMAVRSDVALRYTRTAIVTRVRNPAHRSQETTFRVLLPETAFISGFAMTLNGTTYKAYVKEKDEAKQIYNQAVSQGIGAAHIATKARDSNHFTVSVNVEPNTEAVFNLTYEELLQRRNGVYNHAINLHPGQVVPKLEVKVYIKETQKITVLRVPEIKTGNEVDATEDDKQNPIATIERGHDDREATITFTPDKEEQEKLMSVYAEKSVESRNMHRSWAMQDEPEQTGVLGQFVVQYDVDRPEGGEILVNDGYFVHFFAPSNLPALAKHVVFVLDVSGSMVGRKIEQLKDAMRSILGELRTNDYFNIVAFSSGAKVHDLAEALQDAPQQPAYNAWLYEEESRPARLVPPSRATPENIGRANIIINRLIATGGTNIAYALDVAVALVKRGVDWSPSNSTKDDVRPSSRSSPAVDEAVAETTPEALVSTTEKSTTVASNTNDSEEAKKVEPIIIFLTDGDPTVGESNPKRIINRLSEKNYGPNKSTIFSLAFGEDADRSFLRKLSLRNDGFMRHIYEAADAALQLRDFYRQVSSPLLADVHFTYPKEQVSEADLTKNKFRTFYRGGETVVAGRLAAAGGAAADKAAPPLAAEVNAFCAVEDGEGRRRFRVTPTASGAGATLPLERLWAFLTVRQLLDARDADLVPAPDQPEPKARALQLALKYEFVTPLTSLVVVKPNSTNAVDAESVDKIDNTKPFVASAFSSMPAFAPQYFAVNRMAVLSGRPKNGGGPYMDLVARGPPAASMEDFPEAEHFEIAEDGGAFDLGMFSGPAGTAAGANAAGGFGYSATVLSTPAMQLSTTTAHKSQSQLTEFPWAAPLLDSTSNTLRMQVNGTEVSLKLLDDQTAVPTAEEPCAKATDGGAGVCMYFTRCDAAKTIDRSIYETSYCVVQGGYAGVCCPKVKQENAAGSS